MKVFLDANILFSSSAEKSRVRKLVLIIQKHGTCVSNSYAVNEAERNMIAKKFGTLEKLELLLKNIEINNSLILDLALEIKEKDIPILSGAIAQKCTHLLTGDKKDFGFLFGQSISGVKIVSPQLMATELVKLGILTNTN
jgi:predicted nucleic acid-binding protein